MVVGLAELRRGDDVTSSAVIDHLAVHPAFLALGAAEQASIVARDAEDDAKLQKAIDAAVAEGVLPALAADDPQRCYSRVEVLGRSAEQVADCVLAAVGEEHLAKGCAIIIVGLSGTGKGTTVAKLAEKLKDRKVPVATWSNGNLFRALTLLATTEAVQRGATLQDSDLTPANLSRWMDMLEFGCFDGVWDTQVKEGTGLGLDKLRLLENASGLLKSEQVTKSLVMVAARSQGQVIKFAAAAVDRMSSAGCTVLLEGREATVNYVPSPCRFELALKDPSVIGRRRAAQRVAASAVQKLADGCSGEDIEKALEAAVQELAPK